MGWVKKKNPTQILAWVGLKKIIQPMDWVIKKTQPKSWRGLGWVGLGYLWVIFMQNLYIIYANLCKFI